jgi:hypothetical protein
MKRIFNIGLLSVLLFFLVGFLYIKDTKAAENTSCQNRYVTFVNPVRSRELWTDKSLGPITAQYEELKKYLFPATWLLQYDTLDDKELLDEISGFDKSQETGVFLEVSPKLAGDSGVAYPIYLRWSNPGAVFLSAYSQSERRALIDQLFYKYKRVFGKYPKSVGAWWIDSYSLDYMSKKYEVKAALIVADQKVTDSYGVWGQWWGFPYRPSRANILVPASNDQNSLEIVVIQWAQRDPTLAYGGVGPYSSYSLQANDYVFAKKDTSYFKHLALLYLDCRNSLGQVTIGLETGMESLRQPQEYERQLEYLASVNDLEAVTMSDFADRYFSVYEVNPDKTTFGEDDALWEMTTSYRKNEKLGEYISYDPEVAFKDYFVKDNSEFLDRVMPISGHNENFFPYFLILDVILLIIAVRYKFFFAWAVSTFTAFTAFGLVFRSNYQYGWQVYYGPYLNNLPLTQALILAAVFIIFLVVHRKFQDKLLLILIPLSFGLDRIISVLRYTSIAGERYFGVTFGVSEFIGLKLGNDRLNFVRTYFEPVQFQSLTKFNFLKVWENGYLYFIAYPLVHVLLAYLIWRLIKGKSRRLKFLVILILFCLLIWQLVYIFNSDPTLVKQIGS